MPHKSRLKMMILEEVHRSALNIHHGDTKVYQDLKKILWCPGMKKDVVKFVYSCLVCQNMKIEHHKSYGLMQPLSISEWKWDSLSMDFMLGFPRIVKGYDLIWVIVDILAKSAHFILIFITYSLNKLVEMYINEIMRLHGIPSSLVSYRDPKFTLRFWECLQKAM